MIARVTRFQVNVDKLDESIKAFKESVIPAVKLQKGYRSGYLLADHKTGKCISIAFWDSEKDAIADEQSGHYRKRVDIGKNRHTAPPVRELYEVAVQD
jgi:heme-degrading monooxygenase HmoA